MRDPMIHTIMLCNVVQQHAISYYNNIGKRRLLQANTLALRTHVIGSEPKRNRFLFRAKPERISRPYCHQKLMRIISSNRQISELLWPIVADWPQSAIND